MRLENISNIERLEVFLYGGCLLGSLFLILSFGRLVVREYKRPSREPLRINSYFVSFSSHVVAAVALSGISILRLRDASAGLPIGGSEPFWLALCLALLWMSWTGFHWAATMGRASRSWPLYLLLCTAWGIIILGPVLI